MTAELTSRRIAVVGIGLALLIVATGASLALGSRGITLVQLWHALTAYSGDDPLSSIIVTQRLPRTILGIIVGMCLAAAGTIMQGVTRNPLADPGLLGVNSGASLFVVLAITLFKVTSPSQFVWFALLGAAAAVTVVYLIGARTRQGATPLTLAVAGTALAAGITSVITFILVTHHETMSTYRFWVVGSLAGRSGPGNLSTTLALLPFVVIGLILAAISARHVNVMSMGDEVARSLGIHLPIARIVSAAAVILLAGSGTALAGPLIFIGLVVPHLGRALMGADYRWILLAAAVYGPVVLLGADILGRLVIPRTEIEAGVVVAAVGAPIMIWLVRRKKLVQV